MKMKKRALAILLALAMTLTLMPTVAFAGEKRVSDPKKHQQSTEIGAKGFKALDEDSDWELYPYGDYYLFKVEDNYRGFYVEYNGYGEPPEFEYRLLRNNSVYKSWTPMIVDDDGDPSVELYARNLDLGEYIIEVREVGGDITEEGAFEVYYEDSYYAVYVDGLSYELNSYNQEEQAGIWDYEDGFKASSITVPSQVTLSNGKTYAVTYISSALYGLSTVKSITIPASVTEIRKGIGFYGTEYDEVQGETIYTYQKVPNFTIYGKTGSAAHQYAKDNGFAFRDLEAEAAAAQAADAQARAAAIAAASNINKGTVTAADIQKASSLGATTVTLGPKVKKIKKNSFKGTGITTIVVKTKKLKKGSVKGSLKGSKVGTVKVEIGSKKVNKKFVKKYKKFFTKKNAGKKAKVK